MKFPCKKCILCCMCKTIATDRRQDPDEFCRLVLGKCTTIIEHMKYKGGDLTAPVFKFKPIQFNVFFKFFGYYQIPKSKSIYYLPKRIYKEKSPCILVI